MYVYTVASLINLFTQPLAITWARTMVCTLYFGTLNYDYVWYVCSNRRVVQNRDKDVTI